MSKQDFIRTPESGNTPVDEILKVSKGLIVPHGDGFLLGDMQDVAGYIYVKTADIPANIILQLYIGGQIVEFIPASAFSQVAKSGSYNDLGDKPTIVAVTWDNITGKPAFATVATSGSYNDLLNKPTIPTNNNQLSNGAGYLTVVTWDVVTGKPNFASVATSGSYNDLSNKPTIPTDNNQLTNGAGYITVVTWDAVTGRPSFASVATSGSYNDLSNKPTIPTNNNQLTNGAGYLTAVTWDAVTGKPAFASVATSGNYNDLANLPNLAQYAPIDSPLLKNKARIQPSNAPDGMNLANSALGNILSFFRNVSNAKDEIAFISAPGTVNGATGGFAFYGYNSQNGTAGGLVALFSVDGVTKAFTIPGRLVVGDIAAASNPTVFAAYNTTTKEFETATPAQIAAAINGASGRLAIKKVSANYDATEADHTILVDSSGSLVNIFLMAAALVEGLVLCIKRISSGGYATRISPQEGDTVDGANAVDLSDTTPFTIQAYGGKWYRIA